MLKWCRIFHERLGVVQLTFSNFSQLEKSAIPPAQIIGSLRPTDFEQTSLDKKVNGTWHIQFPTCIASFIYNSCKNFLPLNKSPVISLQGVWRKWSAHQLAPHLRRPWSPQFAPSHLFAPITSVHNQGDWDWTCRELTCGSGLVASFGSYLSGDLLNYGDATMTWHVQMDHNQPAMDDGNFHWLCHHLKELVPTSKKNVS